MARSVVAKPKLGPYFNLVCGALELIDDNLPAVCGSRMTPPVARSKRKKVLLRRMKSALN